MALRHFAARTRPFLASLSQSHFTVRCMAVKAVDWDRLGGMVPSQNKAEFNAWRNKYDTVRGQLNAIPEKPADIDWDFYLSNVKNKALVEKFQAAFGEVVVPFPESNTAELEAQIKEREAAIQADEIEKGARIATAEAAIAKALAEKPYDEMTEAELREADPEGAIRSDEFSKELGFANYWDAPEK